LAGLFLAVLGLEPLYPLRRSTQPRLRRVLLNLGLASVSLILMRLTCLPLVLAFSGLAASRNWGLTGLLDLPRAIEMGLTLAAL
ncbi:hypothetical protein NE584_19630, partial [Clostridium sp. DFI.5.61]|uniref:hypothetical protein n=1 Tax=Clostridium sp. DFI.5.61 TaxID=2965279 RepID=UPI00210CDEA0